MSSKALFEKLSSEKIWQQFLVGPGRIVEFDGMKPPLAAGAEVRVKWSWHGVEHDAVYKIVDWKPSESIAFAQKRGLFKKWTQKLSLHPTPHGVQLRIDVNYELPFQLFGALFNDLWLRRLMETSLRDWLDQISGATTHGLSQEL